MGLLGGGPTVGRQLVQKPRVLGQEPLGQTRELLQDRPFQKGHPRVWRRGALQQHLGDVEVLALLRLPRGIGARGHASCQELLHHIVLAYACRHDQGPGSCLCEQRGGAQLPDASAEVLDIGSLNARFHGADEDLAGRVLQRLSRRGWHEPHDLQHRASRPLPDGGRHELHAGGRPRHGLYHFRHLLLQEERVSRSVVELDSQRPGLLRRRHTDIDLYGSCALVELQPHVPKLGLVRPAVGTLVQAGLRPDVRLAAQVRHGEVAVARQLYVPERYPEPLLHAQRHHSMAEACQLEGVVGRPAPICGWVQVVASVMHGSVASCV
mmetsp:Transcript_65822/g.207929  ORF Transcript_65822/g.207929 Transcript_65822/m.207929 type:complete len:323 (+) Transcript_65822:1190-2158(+)